jgi:hypothetical protein
MIFPLEPDTLFTIFTILVVSAGVAFSIAIWAGYKAREAEREERKS